jgi:deglycase
MDELRGRRIAFLVANEGVEQVELTDPWEAVEQAGGDPVLVAPEEGEVQMMNHLDKADRRPVDRTVESVEVSDFDGLILPGGVANPDRLRQERAAVDFVRALIGAGTPVAAICHAPWTLVEADAVRGRTLTSWPSLQTDVRNAGGHWVDDKVVLCRNGPNLLITSRKPDDLADFNGAILEEFAAGHP